MRVLNSEPNTPGSSVPGQSVGYMPQELALYEEFSIHQNFLFYGKLFGMSQQAIDEREQWLLDFLHIPPSNRSIKKLSGGQRRRVSLACALLHSPPLLLLDEPTVGVDPLLRSRIWSHLATLSQQGTTIIITTHYIEEARQAHYVGFMRNGRILEEGQPDELIGRYEARTLEDVFLKLCTRQEERGDQEGGEEVDKQQEEEERRLEEEERRQEEDEALDEESGRLADQSSINSSMNSSLDTTTATTATSPTSPLPSKPAPSASVTIASYLPRWQYLSACIWRNLMRFRNNLPALLFVFLLPSIQVCLFCIAIGKNPTDLPFGVVNHDVGGNYSARYVDGLERAGLDVRMYDSEIQARSDGRANTIWGYSVVPANYTRNLQLLPGGKYDNGCIIHYSIDQSDFQIAAYLTNAIVGAYTQTIQSLIPQPANSTSGNGQLLPLQADEPLYGTKDSSFTDFIAPGYDHHYCLLSVDRPHRARVRGRLEERRDGPRLERGHPRQRDDAEPQRDAAGDPDGADLDPAVLRPGGVPAADAGQHRAGVRHHAAAGVQRRHVRPGDRGGVQRGAAGHAAGAGLVLPRAAAVRHHLAGAGHTQLPALDEPGATDHLGSQRWP